MGQPQATYSQTPAEREKERLRLLDHMYDSHKVIDGMFAKYPLKIPFELTDEYRKACQLGDDQRAALLSMLVMPVKPRKNTGVLKRVVTTIKKFLSKKICQEKKKKKKKKK